MEAQSITTGSNEATNDDRLSRWLFGASLSVSLVGTLVVVLSSLASRPGPDEPWSATAWGPSHSQAFQLLLLALLTIAFAHGRDRVRINEEARFWSDLAAGLGLASAAAVTALFDDGNRALGLVVDFLAAAAVAAWMLASARQPDLRHRWRVPKLERALAKPQVALWVSGLALYFIVLPAPVWPPTGSAPSSGFILASSGFLAIRWALLWHSTQSRRFVGIYGSLAVANALVAFQAWLEVLAASLGKSPSPLDLHHAWGLLAGAVAAMALWCRGGQQHSAKLSLWEKIQRAEGSLGPFEQTLLAALAFPTLHFLAYELGLFAADRRALHDILVLVWLALLAALAAWQQDIWQRRTRSLTEERQNAARSLRHIHQEVLLSQDRSAQPVTSRRAPLGREDFAALFAACPEMIALNRKSDGRYLEVNPACERLLGYTPDQLRGKTPAELGVWARRRESDELLRRLRDHGTVSDLEVTLLQRGGGKALARLAATEIELHGEACVVTVLREGLPSDRAVRDIAGGEPVPSEPRPA